MIELIEMRIQNIGNIGYAKLTAENNIIVTNCDDETWESLRESFSLVQKLHNGTLSPNNLKNKSWTSILEIEHKFHDGLPCKYRIDIRHDEGSIYISESLYNAHPELNPYGYYCSGMTCENSHTSILKKWICSWEILNDKIELSTDQVIHRWVNSNISHLSVSIYDLE